MKKVLITGAGGFIGKALCKELLESGIEVIAVIRNNGDIQELSLYEGIRIVQCDMKNYKNLHNLILDRDIEVMYHLAWMGSAGELRGNYEVQLENVRATCQLIEECSRIRCKCIVYAGSIMEYEIEEMMRSEMAPSIYSLYSSAKIAADFMAKALANANKIRFVRAIISNIYGPGEHSMRLINTSIRKMLKKEHCAFSDGNQWYDFIYIDDAVKAFMAIGRKGKNNKTYYIGNLSPRLLKEFLKEMRDQIDPLIEIGLGEIPFKGVSLSYKEFDTKALYEDTGFVPDVSFSEGIQKTVEWIKEEMTHGKV